MLESGPLQSSERALDDLRIGLLRIEHDLDERRYRPGPWQRYIRGLKDSPRQMRLAIAPDVSRVSRKLHLRDGRATIPFTAGLVAEVAAALVGGVLIAVGSDESVPWLAALGAFLWIASWQPLVKIAAGMSLGIGYDYAFMLRGEPRFKMQYGSYIAATRASRVLFHLCGTIGSPLGAWFAAAIMRERLPGTARLVMAVFWIVVAINALEFAAGLFGVTRIGTVRTVESSGGAAALELHEALEPTPS